MGGFSPCLSRATPIRRLQMSTLKELKALGGFVSATPIKKEIKFKTSGDDDYTATIHVK